jgi:hypothetical protein
MVKMNGFCIFKSPKETWKKKKRPRRRGGPKLKTKNQAQVLSEKRTWIIPAALQTSRTRATTTREPERQQKAGGVNFK